MNNERNILVAPLNWGLGHATRCIPIINQLISCRFDPIIASDGEALLLLKKEFPKLKSIQLPSYNVAYSKSRTFFNLKLLLDCPRFIRTSVAERNLTERLVEQYNLAGIISDNRPGVFNSKIPSVYLTHQLNVLSGSTSWFTTRMHNTFINKFDQCWVPDIIGERSLSGYLGQSNSLKIPVKYVGTLSRFKKQACESPIDLLVILSGPPPHREILEKKLLEKLTKFKGTVVFVKGKVQDESTFEEHGNLKIYNFLTSDQLENLLNRAKIVLCRSGYTSVMDMYNLNKKVFFIPTPGQLEQEYLAERCEKLKIAPYSSQDDFTIKKLEMVKKFSGFKNSGKDYKLKELFSFFECK